MRIPAGFPWRVIRISSRSASRRYFERSSLIFARATSRFGNPFLDEPGFSLRFGDDGEDLDRLARDVIEHPDVIHSEPKLRAAQPPEPLDAALTHPSWLMTQMRFECIPYPYPYPYPRPGIGLEALERLGRGWREDDRVTHSGYNVARIVVASQGAWLEPVSGMRWLGGGTGIVSGNPLA